MKCFCEEASAPPKADSSASFVPDLVPGVPKTTVTLEGSLGRLSRDSEQLPDPQLWFIKAEGYRLKSAKRTRVWGAVG